MGISPNKQFCSAKYGSVATLPMLAPKLYPYQTTKGMEQDKSSDFSDFAPKQDNPINETVYYASGGSEALQEKVLRLMKTENLHTPKDKE